MFSRIGQWSEFRQAKWITLVLGKMSIQAEFACALSILVLTIAPNCLQFIHVYYDSLKPRSRSFSLLRNLLKFSIFVLFAGLPPNFSSGVEISLKSHIKSHLYIMRDLKLFARDLF